MPIYGRGVYIRGLLAGDEPRPRLLTSVQALNGCGCLLCRAERKMQHTDNAHGIDRKTAEDIAVTRLAEILGGDAAVVDAIKRGYIEVTGSRGGLFRLFTGSHSGNVQYRARPMGPFDRGWETLCAHLETATECSRYENLLAQVRMIQTDETRFREIAL